MRVDENCVVIDSRNAFSIGVAEYVKKLFRVSHEVAVYIAIEPIVITTTINNVKRRVAVAPGSAIICDNSSYVEEFNWVYRVSEQCWGDTYILIPYTSTSICSDKMKRYGFEVEYSEEFGSPHICIDETLDENALKQIIGGGIAEPQKHIHSFVGDLQIAIKRDVFFYVAKGLGVKPRYSGVEIKALPIKFTEKRYNIYLDELATVNNVVALYRFGKGYIVAFQDLGYVDSILYPITIL